MYKRVSKSSHIITKIRYSFDLGEPHSIIYLTFLYQQKRHKRRKFKFAQIYKINVPSQSRRIQSFGRLECVFSCWLTCSYRNSCMSQFQWTFKIFRQNLTLLAKLLLFGWISNFSVESQFFVKLVTCQRFSIYQVKSRIHSELPKYRRN